jgi:hypothetical protein
VAKRRGRNSDQALCGGDARWVGRREVLDALEEDLAAARGSSAALEGGTSATRLHM